MKSRRGQAMLYLSFIFAGLLFLFLAAVVSPIAGNFSTHMYVVGADIVEDSQGLLVGINDSDVRDRLNATFVRALASTEDNITITNSGFQYGWVVALVAAAFVAFVFTRKQVEYGGQGGFV